MTTEKRLIDAQHYDKILEERELSLMEYSGSISGAIKGCRALLADEPTVDAVEVVHGRWGTFEMFPETPFLNGFPCSVCGKRVPFILGYNFKYCPNCGAKMDGGINK